MPIAPAERAIETTGVPHAPCADRAPAIATSRRRVRLIALRTLAVAVMAGGLVACGGGGGGGDAPAPVAAAPAFAPTPAPSPAPAGPDPIVSSVSVEDRCVAPRTGIDPATNAAYFDRAGTLDQEKQWVRAFVDETYLWYDEVPPSVRAADYTNTIAYFDRLKTPAVTASGAPKDKFHFTYDTAFYYALSQQGQSAGYGFETAILKATAPRDIRVAFTDPGTPAAAAGIARGAKILAVDGSDAVSGPAAPLNAGLFPSKAGESHAITVSDGSTTRTVTLVSAIITSTPVQNVKVLDTPNGKTGYLLFNDFIATSESQLVAAMNTFKTAGVTHLVIDMRYNGGGLLSIASRLAYMAASPQAVQGKFFEKLQFNAKNPFRLTDAQATTPFNATTGANSAPAGQPLPQLGLARVAVLAGPGTCSASESVVNGLRGVDVQVDLIGATTCGKPYGFIPQDNCGTTYFTIQFKGVNSKGFGDYTDGLAPTCQVADDFDKPLGDPAEKRLAAALSYRATGICPPASSNAPMDLLGTASKRASTAPSASDAFDAEAVAKPMARVGRLVSVGGGEAVTR